MIRPTHNRSRSSVRTSAKRRDALPPGRPLFADGKRRSERVAAIVIRGDGVDAGFAALHAWIAESGEHESGELREIYLDCNGPRETWVVELQLALATRD